MVFFVSPQIMAERKHLYSILLGVKNGLVISAVLFVVLLFIDFTAETLLHKDLFQWTLGF